MADDKELDALTARFAALGASDPQGWAASQIEEGIPQLARFVFLREAWRCITSETDDKWIDDAIAQFEHDPTAPYAGAGRALKRLRALGAQDRDITDVIRAKEVELLFRFCYLLADPGVVEHPAAKGVNWSLVQIDDEGEPIAVIDALHESVLETDPSGREMRPRPEA